MFRKKLILLILSIVLVIGNLGLLSGTSEAAGYEKVLRVKKITMGYNCSSAITEDDSLWMWGENYSGRLGDGTETNHITPIKIMDSVADVSLGTLHSSAVKTDKSLWMWGNGYYGQLGNGNQANSSTPVKVTDHVTSVSLGYYHSGAVKEDGSLWMWGANSYGQLGDGTETDRYTPVKVLDHVAAVSLGYFHSAAIKEDGSLWMWGWNEFSQLGDKTENIYNTPVKVLDNVVSISSGSFHNGAIDANGDLWTWGENAYGQLGNGKEEFGSSHKNPPMKVLDNVSAISFGESHSSAIKTDGSLWIWGANFNGRLGDGTEINHNTPVKIMDDVIDVSLGDSHSGAVKKDGSLWMWGRNDDGELGTGDMKDQSVPQNITNQFIDKLPFKDVLSGDWFEGATTYVYENRIMTGLTPDTFGPAQDLSRAQFATILYRMNHSPEVGYSERFPDVPDNQFYTKPVLWASRDDVKVVTGYADGYFGPNDNITREQMAVMMYRWAAYKGYDTSARGNLSGFPDQASVSSFSREAMEWAVASGLISGNADQTLAPQGNASRAVCATIIMRFMEKIAK